MPQLCARVRLPAARGACPSPRLFSASSVAAHGTPPRGGRVPPPTVPSPASYRRQRRKEWVIVGVASSLAAFGGWYYWVNIRTQAAPLDSRGFSSAAPKPAAFSIPVRSPKPGQPNHKVITPLSAAEVDSRLRQNERSTVVDRPPGACLVARYDTNQLASNDPIEDKHAEVIVERDRGIHENCSETKEHESAEQPVPGDLCFFAVMDGHAGPHTSVLLSNKLIAFVALELDKVFRETGEYAQMARSKASLRSTIWRALFSGDSKSAGHRLAQSALDGDPEIVSRAITKGFRGLDKEIVNTPLELLKLYELSRAATANASQDAGNARSLSSLAHSIWPVSLGQSSNSPFASQKSAYDSLLPALSGSCALMVYVDSARRDLYVACTGDSRAVAGYWDERAGRWEVEALSVDQTGRNPDEVKRMQREHPKEQNHVIMRGRVLGGLEPTRAFGDARYKWDRGVQTRMYDAFLPGGSAAARGPPRYLETPPYVTAEPVVEHRRVPQPDTESRSLVSSSSRELRFIIMATDGLWDLLSSAEAVSLVAGHLAGIRGEVAASELHQRCFNPANASSAAGSSELTHHPLRRSGHPPTYTFEDDNLGTHLMRNALGGAARDRVAGLLAIPSPESRRYRDDITVNVILFHSPARQAAEAAAAAAAASTPAPATSSASATAQSSPDVTSTSSAGDSAAADAQQKLKHAQAQSQTQSQAQSQTQSQAQAQSQSQTQSQASQQSPPPQTPTPANSLAASAP
ncbi:[pyruvate dehydrogenase (acetyl-transferring)]-phosphatase [Malassezia cuniculi]|uniref:[pyruvate dehydrogenase (Acetyl-transferring)]-phosphatase n=1 Tax=Malassezia cuniculi TaxID=948313 RepID=A0AAF0ER41_9BASI|nr:[pyruvate dehydrogenase (acetyl-transferring)]-phosphatase [Malassezia cuniculi]